MQDAFLWAALAASSLVFGGLLAWRIDLGNRTLGIVMAFGAGVLISAVAYELVFESLQMARFTGFPILGLFAGACTFFFCDQWISSRGGGGRKAIDTSHASGLVVPLVLAIVLDGLPESVVIGVGILDGGTVSLAMLAAVFISNLPEAVASTSGMRAGGWKLRSILMLWITIALASGVASALGYGVLGGAPVRWLAFVQTFAGGAILMMLANTMMPEAYKHAGRLAGVFTVLGFAVSAAIVVLERSL